jgi:hypothetical protein
VKTAIIALALAAISFPSHARDNGQWAQADPAIRDWVDHLTDRAGISCCRTADGYDVQWDTVDGHYRVFILNRWIVVPDGAVLTQPNRLGVARVWYIAYPGDVHIRCFLPGAQG